MPRGNISFLDGNFVKTLSACVRFGTPLIVLDVESLDPIINPILNASLVRTGSGRTLVRLGGDDVDYSPKFTIVLMTSDPQYMRVLPASVSSRVTLVNFTVTPDSLANQALSMVVRSLKPTLEVKRFELLRLQGERGQKVRELEEKLLEQIGSAEGSILDNDELVIGMAEVKGESARVVEQLASSGEVLEELQATVQVFGRLAKDAR